MGQANLNTLKSIIKIGGLFLGDGLLIFSHTLIILNLECVYTIF